MAKSVERPAPINVVEAMRYFVVYEHLYGGIVRKGNDVINMKTQIEIDNIEAIRSIEKYLTEALKKS